jgi:hypothetical protein
MIFSKFFISIDGFNYFNYFCACNKKALVEKKYSKISDLLKFFRLNSANLNLKT